MPRPRRDRDMRHLGQSFRNLTSMPRRAVSTVYGSRGDRVTAQAAMEA